MQSSQIQGLIQKEVCREMKMNLGVRFEQQQKMVLSSNMQQAIKILQMSNYELYDHIQDALQDNLFLDIAPPAEAGPKEIDYRKLIEASDFSKESVKSDENEQNPLYLLSEEKSFTAYLEEQVRELCKNKLQKQICLYLIENLDHRGYLCISLKEVGLLFNVSEEAIEDALHVIRNLEPDGIGAKDLKECLKIQLVKKNLQDPILYKMIDCFLEMLGENKYELIAKELHINAQKAQEYGDIIKTLNPIPSSGFFTGEKVEYIVPDIYVKKIDEKYHILMNDAYLPRLLINKGYQQILQNETDLNAAAYLKERLNKAVFFLQNIERRKNTIYRIVESILEIQREYFEYGKQYLKPMTMKDVASILHLNESTISRAVKNKYISTHRGTVRMKDLFTSEFLNNGDHTSTLVKNTIKEMIDGEDKKNPLSDQSVCDLLKSRNIHISRRTVAKYREEIGIKSTKARKRF